MLGFDSKESGWLNFIAKKMHLTAAEKMKGHLIQIGTGEGKSIILGILSAVLALLGFDVSVILI